MHLRTRQAFLDEMQKMAEEHQTPEEKSDHRSTVAFAGTVGANLGALGVTLAMMKGTSQPATEGEMTRYVKEMASKMEVPSVGVQSESGKWNPFYDPNSKSVNVPTRSRDAIIAHELGHAKNDFVLESKSKFLRVPHQTLQALSRVGSMISLVPTLDAAARDEKMSYTPGVVQAIISSPMIAEEAAASARATAHLIKQHGAGKGVWKSLPLLPAFTTYAAIAGAPLLVTYLRRRMAEKAALLKEKKSYVLASQLSVSYSSP